MDLERLKGIMQWVTATVVGFWHGLPELTQLLIWLMAIDIIFGLAVAIKSRNLSPSVAWAGVTKKLLSLLMIALAALLNPYANGLMEIHLVQAASAFYIVPELMSITRNAATMDVPIFVQLGGLTQYFRTVSGQQASKSADE